MIKSFADKRTQELYSKGKSKKFSADVTSRAAIKPFVIGRKNWLFSNTRSGAHASALLYSLVETAKANGIQPSVYLTALFEQLPHCKANDSLDHLLPWAMTL